MTGQITLGPAIGPIRVRVSATEPVSLRPGTAPIAIRPLGHPGPQGETGAQGDPGITVLPTDTPINGGFF